MTLLRSVVMAAIANIASMTLAIELGHGKQGVVFTTLQFLCSL